MNRRRLGPLPRPVSEIGLGTAQLANTDGASPNVKPLPADAARRVLRAALDAGVDFFDTGDQYGTAETLLGELEPSVKARITVATKAGLRDDGVRDFTPAYLASRIDRSLRRLRVDCLDLFALNKPSAAQLEDGSAFDFLASQKKAGRIRWAGVVVGEPAAGDLCLRSGAADCLQVLYNLLYQETGPLIARAAARGAGIVVRSPLNSGLLSGTYDEKTVFPASDERSRYFSGPAFRRRVEALKAVQRDLAVADAGLLEFSLRFILSEPGVSTVIPGASSPEQARRYAACSGLPPLDAATLSFARESVSRRLGEAAGAFQLP